MKRKKTEENDAFSEVEHRRDNQVASHNYACVNKAIRHVTTREQKAPINMQKQNKLRVSCKRD